ncbi:MAG: CRISPR system precrRNA processing endoribonuclease RAMP protein Cas6 [Desulfosarcina sp.]|nr:CRISPR system precrRNA processing endoribonuclease RAMP protein Cas6 [Desulfosarcina sp.]
MLYGNYSFKCRFESEAHLPEYKGSTFRGVFGRALKQVVCALKRQACSTCLLKRECLYPAVFEPRLAIAQIDNGGRTALPHPYVIQPPPDVQSIYPEGASFNFNLLLFGSVNKRLPYFVYALDQMGRIGIGKKIDGRRATFRLEAVESSGQEIYAGADQKLSDTTPCTDLKLTPAKDQQKEDSTVALKFETPLRIKHHNHLSRELPFHLLVRAMLRRAATLLNHYDGGEPDLDYAGMVRRARDVKTVDTTLVWEDWRRYSLRQDQAMMMGGLKGSVTYAGDLGEYLPLIDFCTKVHLGKQTTFGLGRFSVEETR